MTPPTWLYWPAAAAPWVPSDLADLQCWLDASDSSTITLSGSSISLWEDKAGSNDADDAVNNSNTKITTQRPTIATAAQNSLDAVNFNGSQWFDHNTARGMLRNRSCALMAVAMKYGSVNTSDLHFAWTQRGDPNGVSPNRRYELYHRGTNVFRVLSGRLDADTVDVVVDESNTPPYDTNWHIHVVVCDWAADTLSYYIDGSLSGTDTYATNSGQNTSDTDLGTTSLTRTAIGALNREGQFPLNTSSRIGEMICAAKSSGSYATSDREKLEGYLAWKWGLESNLPNGHPYENAAP